MPSLEEQLIESSRELIDIIVGDIGNDQAKFDKIMALVYKDEKQVSMRAAWVAFLAYERHPKLVRKHKTRLFKALQTTKVDGVKRAVLKILYDLMDELPEDEFGKLADLAFSWAGDPGQAIAVRAFSIDILLKVTKSYPDISPELIAVLQGIIPDGSRGLKNKCKKLLKELDNSH
jgi:hypothetical protein